MRQSDRLKTKAAASKFPPAADSMLATDASRPQPSGSRKTGTSPVSPPGPDPADIRQPLHSGEDTRGYYRDVLTGKRATRRPKHSPRFRSTSPDAEAALPPPQQIPSRHKPTVTPPRSPTHGSTLTAAPNPFARTRTLQRSPAFAAAVQDVERQKARDVERERVRHEAHHSPVGEQKAPPAAGKGMVIHADGHAQATENPASPPHAEGWRSSPLTTGDVQSDEEYSSPAPHPRFETPPEDVPMEEPTSHAPQAPLVPKSQHPDHPRGAPKHHKPLGAGERHGPVHLPSAMDIRDSVPVVAAPAGVVFTGDAKPPHLRALTKEAISTFLTQLHFHRAGVHQQGRVPTPLILLLDPAIVRGIQRAATRKQLPVPDPDRSSFEQRTLHTLAAILDDIVKEESAHLPSQVQQLLKAKLRWDTTLGYTDALNSFVLVYDGMLIEHRLQSFLDQSKENRAKVAVTLAELLAPPVFKNYVRQRIQAEGLKTDEQVINFLYRPEMATTYSAMIRALQSVESASARTPKHSGTDTHPESVRHRPREDRRTSRHDNRHHSTRHREERNWSSRDRPHVAGAQAAPAPLPGERQARPDKPKTPCHGCGELHWRDQCPLRRETADRPPNRGETHTAPPRHTPAPKTGARPLAALSAAIPTTSPVDGRLVAHNRSLPFMVDTGAVLSCISKTAASAFGSLAQRIPSGNTFVTASGTRLHSTECLVLRGASCHIGPRQYKVRTLRLCVVDGLHPDVILGAEDSLLLTIPFTYILKRRVTAARKQRRSEKQPRQGRHAAPHDSPNPQASAMATPGQPPSDKPVDTQPTPPYEGPSATADAIDQMVQTEQAVESQLATSDIGPVDPREVRLMIEQRLHAAEEQGLSRSATEALAAQLNGPLFDLFRVR